MYDHLYVFLFPEWFNNVGLYFLSAHFTFYRHQLPSDVFMPCDRFISSSQINIWRTTWIFHGNEPTSAIQPKQNWGLGWVLIINHLQSFSLQTGNNTYDSLPMSSTLRYPSNLSEGRTIDLRQTVNIWDYRLLSSCLRYLCLFYCNLFFEISSIVNYFIQFWYRLFLSQDFIQKIITTLGMDTVNAFSWVNNIFYCTHMRIFSYRIQIEPNLHAFNPCCSQRGCTLLWLLTSKTQFLRYGAKILIWEIQLSSADEQWRQLSPKIQDVANNSE